MNNDDTFNFNLLLAKALSDGENENNDTCLISNEPLEENHIKLNCSHTFNYGPLFKEIVIQKTIKNYLEVQKLDKYSMKCPYCRGIQKGILPPRTGFSSIKYVNYPMEYVMKTNKCSYTFVSGKKKNQICNKLCHEQYCTQHQKIIEKRAIKLKEKQQKEEQKKKNKKNKKNKKIYNELSHTKKTQKQLDSFFSNVSQTCTKVTTHPRKKSERPYFVHKCQHKFTKGKNKGKYCNNFMDCTGYSGDLSKSYPKYYEKYFCKTHAKSKKNKNAIKEIVYPNMVFIRDTNNNNIKDKDLIDKHYSKYSNSPNYEFVVANYTCDPCYFAFKKDYAKISSQENQIITSITI